MGKKILLHACCGPCSTASLERLLAEGYEPIVFYTNDNIFPEEEYERRFDNLERVTQKYGVCLVKDSYDHDAWREDIKGHEGDREGEARCSLCFRHNLSKAHSEMKREGLSSFTTTLSVSRFKNSQKIFSEGALFEGFEEIDFKKKGGFERSVRLSREMGLYRQRYCGCEFSEGEIDA